MPKLIDLTGQRFGKLTVLRREGVDSCKKVTWMCACDCGKEKAINSQQLKNGQIKSCGCIWKYEKGEASFNQVFARYQKNASIRGYSWSLSKEEFKTLTRKKCSYCGGEPLTVFSSHYNGDYIYNGVDRVDNTVGYHADNVVPCCSVCNRAKGTMTLDEFMNWAKRLVTHSTQPILPNLTVASSLVRPSNLDS